MEKFSKIRAIAQKLFQSKDYQEYDLEVEGSWLFGLCYYLNVYAGNKKFRFLLDSGCVNSVIPNRFLKYFAHSYMSAEYAESMSGHINYERTYFAAFGLESNATNQNILVEYVSAPSKKACPILNEECSGILGATFLSRCEVDFRNAKIRVYRNKGKAMELSPDPFADVFIETLASLEAGTQQA